MNQELKSEPSSHTDVVMIGANGSLYVGEMSSDHSTVMLDAFTTSFEEIEEEEEEVPIAEEGKQVIEEEEDDLNIVVLRDPCLYITGMVTALDENKNPVLLAQGQVWPLGVSSLSFVAEAIVTFAVVEPKSQEPNLYSAYKAQSRGVYTMP